MSLKLYLWPGKEKKIKSKHGFSLNIGFCTLGLEEFISWWTVDISYRTQLSKWINKKLTFFSKLFSGLVVVISFGHILLEVGTDEELQKWNEIFISLLRVSKLTFLSLYKTFFSQANKEYILGKTFFLLFHAIAVMRECMWAIIWEIYDWRKNGKVLTDLKCNISVLFLTTTSHFRISPFTNTAEI